LASAGAWLGELVAFRHTNKQIKYIRENWLCQLALQVKRRAFFMSGISADHGDSLLLDVSKNISNFARKKHDKKGFGVCPNSGFYATLVVHGESGDSIKTVLLRCKSWKCPVCAKQNAWILKKKTESALQGMISKVKSNGFRTKYYVKFLTLTVPGKSFRAKVTREYAEELMKKAFNKLMTALRKKYGKYEYIWGCEPQGDGYPHMHVVLIGHNIAPVGILDNIKNLWIKKYKMGFVKINAVTGGIKKISSYLSKYISKELGKGRKNSRVFSMSKEMRRMFKLPEREYTVIEFGRVHDLPEGGKQYQKIWEIDEHGKMLVFEERAVLRELMEYFESVGKELHEELYVHEQIELPF
jgi:hypothetical protein